jgi:hypothetical protein
MTNSLSPRNERPGKRRFWRHPAIMALGAALVIIAASFVPTLWHMRSAQQVDQSIATHDAPWDVDVAADGAVRALGLRLPGSTLADVQAQWGEGLQVALMVSRGVPAALEASVENARPGGVAGRLVVTAQASPPQIVRWQAGAVKSETVSPQTRRLTLGADDLAEAMRSPLTSIGFIPQVQLEAQVLRQRFGEPRQVIVESQSREHWLYPERGLAIALDGEGRELLQYVAPDRFDVLLRAPLLSALKRAGGPAVRTGQG